MLCKTSVIILVGTAFVVLAVCTACQPHQQGMTALVEAEDAHWVCLERAFPMKPFNGHDEPLVFSRNMSRVALKACIPGAAEGNWRSRQVLIDGQEGCIYDGVGSVVFSPDSLRAAYGATVGDHHFLVLDGKEGPQFDGGVLSVVFSPDSRHVAYAGGDFPTTVLFDGKELGSYEYVDSTSFTFSSDSAHFAYCASTDRQQAVYLDGRPVERFDALVTFSMRFFPNAKGLSYAFRRGGKAYLKLATGEAGPFDDVNGIFFAVSPDSHRFACPVKRNDKWFLFCEDKEFGPYSFEPHPVFSSDSQHLAHVGCETKNSATVFLDGKSLGTFSGVTDVTFSPDGKLHAFAGTRNGKALLYADGQVVAEDEAMDQVAFSPDSRRLVAVAGNREQECIVEAGKRGRTYRSIRSLCFSQDSAHLAFVAVDKEEGYEILVIDGQEVFRVRGEIWREMVFSREGFLRAGAVEFPSTLAHANPTAQEVLAAMKKARLLLLLFRPR
jgi:WD40 repeat protein